MTCNSKLEWHLSEIAGAFLEIPENKEREINYKTSVKFPKDMLSNIRTFKVEKGLIISFYIKTHIVSSI